MSVNKEDCLMWALGNNERGTPIERVLKDAEAIRVWIDESGSVRPESSPVSEFTDAVAERDRARNTAVRLEQVNAELEKRLEQAVLDSARFQKALLEAMQELEGQRTHHVRGILLELKHEAAEATLVVQQSYMLETIKKLSDRYGVSV